MTEEKIKGICNMNDSIKYEHIIKIPFVSSLVFMFFINITYILFYIT